MSSVDGTSFFFKRWGVGDGGRERMTERRESMWRISGIAEYISANIASPQTTCQLSEIYEIDKGELGQFPKSFKIMVWGSATLV